MIIMKIPQNFIISHLKFWLISQISAHMLKKIKFDTFFLLPTFSGKQNQGCGNSRILYLPWDKEMAIMYLSNENFTCPKEQKMHKELKLLKK